MGSYTHLDLDDRRRLYQLINTGRSPRQAAAELGRHASTIYRELKRNRHLDEEPVFRGYFPVTAQTKAAARRSRGGKIIRRHELAAYGGSHMRCYTHLDLDDRRRRYQLISTGRSPRQAAVELGRHASTICRELKRNRHLDGRAGLSRLFPGHSPRQGRGSTPSGWKDHPPI